MTPGHSLYTILNIADMKIIYLHIIHRLESKIFSLLPNVYQYLTNCDGVALFHKDSLYLSVNR